MQTDEKERAKQIIVEIVRESGGFLVGTTNLYKAFYHAHLKYAEERPGYLSSWPIARMPHGPGIHKGGSLLDELRNAGVLEVGTVLKGNRTGITYRLVGNLEPTLVPPDSAEAIRYGVAQVKDKHAREVSDKSHQMSRSWRRGIDGQMLNVYIDSRQQNEFEEEEKAIRKIADTFRAALDD